MKINKTSFLFFYFILVNSVCAFNLSSQNIKDSTSIYYESITEIKDIKLTIKSFSFFEKKAKRLLSLKDTINAAYCFELISLGQFKMGFLYESEFTTIKALKLLDHIKSNSKAKEAKERLSNQLGLLYREKEDFDNSYRYYNQAIELNKNLVNKIAIITNIATNYAEQDKFQKAVEELYRYYEDVFSLENSSIKATYLDNLGYYQSKINNPTALKNMKLALGIRLKLNDLIRLFSSYRHLSLFYFDKGNKKEALKYAKKTKVISDSLNSSTFQKEALKLNLRLENNLNFNKYLELSNNIEKENKLKENKFAAIKYNVTEKERIINEKELKLKTSELQEERQKKLKFIYLFSGLIILLISIFSILAQKNKHKKEKVQQVYNTETRISKKVHDEVANDLYHVMTKLQSKNDSHESVLDDLEGIYNKTRDISKENSTIDVNQNYKDLLNDLLLSYKTNDINVVTKNITKVNWEALSDLKKTTLYRVLQELMTNMRKHSKASIVFINFNKTKNKIVVDYKDNGVGCDLVKSNGLLNAENRMTSINGTITFESQTNNSFKAKITV